MNNFLYEFYYHIIASPQFLFAAITISLAMKIYFLSMFIPQGLRKSTTKTPWIFLIGIFFGSIAGDVSWIIKLARHIFIPILPYGVVVFFVRIAWAFLIIQYQSLSLFMESLIKKHYSLHFLQKIIISFSTLLSFYFFYIAFFEKSLTDEYTRNLALESLASASRPLEVTIMKNNALYIFAFLAFPSLLTIFFNIRNKVIPKILRHQIAILIKYMIAPFLLAEFIFATHLHVKTFQAHAHTLASLSALFLTCMIYYCIKKVIGLRFLNASNHVENFKRFNFIDDFKHVLENLGKATNKEELTHIVQTFFKDAFNISAKKTIFTLRSADTNNYAQTASHTAVERYVENFISTDDERILDFIIKSKILIYDELVFSNFYHTNNTQTVLIQFLEQINADIFLPIYQKEKMVGYIIVETQARKELYNKVERDEMIVLASYIGTIVHLLQSRNFDILVQQEKELHEELYAKHQEVNQYKESIRSFLRTTKKDIGIIFYKNRRFTFGNHAAKELIKININMQEGHPITRTLQDIVRHVQEYKQTKTCFVKTHDGKELVLNGILSLENSSVIITVHFPEISDVVKKQADFLKDPTQWDYSLYLETTKSGQLINQLIPGQGETLLNFKIDLLKIALSLKASLLEAPEEDLTTMVEVIHHISLREVLETIELSEPAKNHDTTIQLFGINPLLDPSKQHTPLLQKLDGVGTLFIKNIHYLHPETQQYLADFLRTGSFSVFKSDQKITSNVRFICSSDENLAARVEDKTFSPALFHELKKTSLCMPSLTTLPETELYDLADGFIQQALKTDEFKNLLELTNKEKSKLALSRPVSLQELKTRIQQLLMNKSKKNEIYQETQFDPAYAIVEPDLMLAARLGKQALKDEKIMNLLWNKFKNQNKIATFLGVNRSSVNRRCKEYKLC